MKIYLYLLFLISLSCNLFAGSGPTGYTESADEVYFSEPTNVAYGVDGIYKYLFNQIGPFTYGQHPWFGGMAKSSGSDRNWFQTVSQLDIAPMSANLSAAFTALKKHITGTSNLSGQQIRDQITIIENNLSAIGVEPNVIGESFDLVQTYESVMGPLFLNDNGNRFPREIQAGKEIHYAMFLIQDAIMRTYSTGKLEAYPSLYDGFKFETAQYFPGDVSLPADPNNIIQAEVLASNTRSGVYIWITEDISARRPTGAYVAPGTLVKVKVPPSIVGKGFTIRVGTHYWDFSYKTEIRRLDRATIIYPILKEEITIGCPLGGSIHFEAPQGSNEGLVNLTITGAVRSPFFSMKQSHTTTASEWENIERNHLAPWTDFETDKVLFSVPTSWIYAKDDPTSLMQDWDTAMDAVSDLLGKERLRTTHSYFFQPDVHIAHGAYGIGYPQVNRLYDPLRSEDGDKQQSMLQGPVQTSYVAFHEMGHAMVPKMFSGEHESIVNILLIPVLQAFGWDLDSAFGESVLEMPHIGIDEAALTWMVTDNFRAGNKMDGGSKTEFSYQHRGSGKYADIAKLFGWDTLSAYFKSFHDTYNNANYASRYEYLDENTDEKMLRLSRATGVDIRPLIHFWGVHPENQTSLQSSLDNENLEPSQRIYDRLLHYKSKIPGNNAEFQTHVDVVFPEASRPDPNVGWTVEYQHADLLTRYDESYSAAAKNEVQDIIDYYFPNGRPGTGEGTITREWWLNVSGSTVADLTSQTAYPDQPDGEEMLYDLEAPENQGESYGSRIYGFLHPPASGNYTFWIASDDGSELWLSSNASPSSATLISRLTNATSSRNWDAAPEQKSATIYLQEGSKYYILALHKEGHSGDHLAVAWEGPGISREIINGMYLSPWFVDETPPTVNFGSPSANVSLAVGDDLYVRIDAFDNVGVNRVRLYKDGVELARSEGAAPYEWGASGQNDPELQNLSKGSFVLRAVATDPSGLTGENSITVTVTSPPVLINVNFDTASRTGTALDGPAYGTGGNDASVTWNQILAGPGGMGGGITGTNLLDSTGAATTVDFICTGGQLYSYNSPDLTLLTGGISQFVPTSEYTLTISGLSAGEKYDVFLPSFNATENGSRALISTANTTTTPGTRIADSNGPNGNDSTWVFGTNFVVFQDVEPDGSNEITFTLDSDWTTDFSKRVYLNGFQIMTAGASLVPPGQASNPSPLDGTIGLLPDTDLSWTYGVESLTSNVYFGTDSTPDSSEFKGNQGAITYDPGTLAQGTYYWRIDEVNNDGITTGTVWSFSVGSPGKALSPMPYDGMTAVSIYADLRWGKGENSTSSDIYFGTDSTPDAGEFKGNQTGVTYDPGNLLADTTYYWRVDQRNSQGVTSSDVWSFSTHKDSANTVKIFILAGQSNMEGHGEMSPLGTPGTLETLVQNDPGTFGHLKNGSNWAVRDDVWISYKRGLTTSVHLTGGLSAGYGVASNTIGPELQFGNIMGDLYGEQVLIIKAAWGGKSLAVDFRPPGSGCSLDAPVVAGDDGYYYQEMMNDVIDAMSNMGTHFPAYNGQGYEIVGFGWHQGFNDRVIDPFPLEYEVNMENFIKDIRGSLGVPNLPFVIGTTGMGGEITYSDVELAQLEMKNWTVYPEFQGTVDVFDSKSFWREIANSPADQSHHWNRNAESYFLIGDEMAKQMTTLLQNSIPIGPVGYIYCANEGDSFVLPERSDVAYGGSGQFNYLYGQTGTITFNNGSFGDPISGMPKAGFYKIADINPDADNDGDGIVNLLEIALGGDLNVVDADLIRPTLSQSGVDLDFRFRKWVSGLTYIVETSEDLSTWDNFATYLDTDLRVKEYLTEKVPLNVYPSDKLFVRLRVVEP